MGHWELLANNVTSGDSTSFREPRFPEDTVEGIGFHEAPDGTAGAGANAGG